MIRMESRQIILSILGIAILIIAFVGVSYATVNVIFHDTFESGISTGTISLLFDNNSSSVSMKNVMPISDAQGKVLSGDGNVYDFSVHTILSPDTTINYEISAEKLSIKEESLSNNNVRLYLEKQENNGFKSTPITSIPKGFEPLEKNSFLGSKKNTMVLYSGTFSNNSDTNKKFSDSFRLRMWVAEDTIIDSVSRGFKIKLNVTAKVV
ncbi:MAG TPA: hypothetical protein IAB35_00860 [Candidatus Faecimonas gallistercoris]|nr:hypothetical protein [Candidatus Faecimonas gallistercoris]